MMVKPFVKCGKLWVTIEGKSYRAVMPYKHDRQSYYIVCPLCGEQHTHGLKAGLRYSHCDVLEGSYYLHVLDKKE